MLFKIVIGLIINVIAVKCYPGGAPLEACDSMTPSHGSNSASDNSASPYSVTVSSTNITAGEVVTVTLASGTNAQFRGIFLQARATEDGEAIGSWAVPNSNFQLRACGGMPDSALTHTNANDKNSGITFEWTSPADNPASSVYIYATVVQVFSTFYVRLPSEVVSIAAVEMETTAPAMETNSTTTPEGEELTTTTTTEMSTTTTEMSTTTTQMTTTSSGVVLKISYSVVIGALLFRRLVAVFNE